MDCRCVYLPRCSEVMPAASNALNVTAEDRFANFKYGPVLHLQCVVENACWAWIGFVKNAHGWRLWQRSYWTGGWLYICCRARQLVISLSHRIKCVIFKSRGCPSRSPADWLAGRITWSADHLDTACNRLSWAMPLLWLACGLHAGACMAPDRRLTLGCSMTLHTYPSHLG